MVVTLYEFKSPEKKQFDSLRQQVQVARLSRDIPSKISYTLEGEQREISIKRHIKSKTQGSWGSIEDEDDFKRFDRKYEVSETHFILEPENENEEKQVIASASESRRIPESRYVGIVVHDDFNLVDAESIALQADLLKKDYRKFEYNSS